MFPKSQHLYPNIDKFDSATILFNSLIGYFVVLVLYFFQLVIASKCDIALSLNGILFEEQCSVNLLFFGFVHPSHTNESKTMF